MRQIEFAEFAEAFYCGWNAYRKHGNEDISNEEFMQLIITAYNRSHITENIYTIRTTGKI